MLNAPVFAQSRPASTATADSSDRLEEITVTARRQEENLQDTPISVSAISSESLERLDINEIEKIGQYVPNVVMSPASNNPFGVVAFIRGIGTQENLLTVDAPVGLYLDGVYLGRQNDASFDLIDLERVEVLRGPQGTLFGRNTTGGAINMVSKLPDTTFGVDEKLSYGSFNDWYSRTRINTGELGDSGIRGTISYMHRERDGYVNNPITDDAHDPGAFKSDSVWASLRGEWSRFTATLAGTYEDAKAAPPPFQLVAASPNIQQYYDGSVAYGGQPLIVNPTHFLGTLDVRNDPSTAPFVPGEPYSNGDVQETTIWGSALTLQYDLNPSTAIKSITSYRKWNGILPNNYSNGGILQNASNADGSNLGVQEVSPFISAQIYKQHQTSEELQLLGHSDQWKYVIGLFYFDEYVSEVNPTWFTYVISPTYGINFNDLLQYYGDSKSEAGFGQVSYRPAALNEKLELTAGGRYTEDSKDVTVDNPALPGNPGNALYAYGSRNFYNFSYLLSVSYNLTDDVMTYAKYSTGYRSGGFSPRNAGLPTFDFEPETARTYEVGLKSEWWQHRLRANLAAFYTDYDNLQVAQYTGGNGFTENAKAHYTGGELEVQMLPTTQVAIDASIGVVNPIYDRFPVANPNGPGMIDVAAQAHVPYSSKFTSHLGVQYTVPRFSAGELSFRVDYSYQSERWFFAENISNPFNDIIKDPGQNRLGARIQMASIPVRGALLDVSVFGENLLNESLTESGVDFGSALGFAGVTYDLPRHYGVDLRAHF